MKKAPVLLGIFLFFNLFFRGDIAISEVKSAPKKEQSGTNITEKLKQAIHKLGDKVHDAIDFIRKKSKTIAKFIPGFGGDDEKKDIIINMHIPPPDVDIFVEEPTDIMTHRPNVYADFDGNSYIVDDVWVFANSGENVGESMDIAYRKAVDMAFSQIILDNHLDHLNFTMFDAMSCLAQINVGSQAFHENEYLGSFVLYFNINSLEKITEMKKYQLFLQGLNEHGKPMENVPVKVNISSKKYWMEVEKRLIASGVLYSIVGMSKDTAIVLLGRGVEVKNIIKKLENLGLKINLDNKQYYLELLEQKD